MLSMIYKPHQTVPFGAVSAKSPIAAVPSNGSLVSEYHVNPRRFVTPFESSRVESVSVSHQATLKSYQSSALDPAVSRCDIVCNSIRKIHVVLRK